MAIKMSKEHLEPQRQEIVRTLDERVNPNIQNDEWVTDTTETGFGVGLQSNNEGKPGYYDSTRSYYMYGEQEESGQNSTYGVRDADYESKGLKLGIKTTGASYDTQDDKTRTDIHRLVETKSAVSKRGKVKSSKHSVSVHKTTAHGAPRGANIQTYEAKISPKNQARYGELVTKLALKKIGQAKVVSSKKGTEEELPII